MKLIAEKKHQDRTVRVYELEGYEVTVTSYSSGRTYIDIRPTREDRYLPWIYPKQRLDGHVTGYPIETTSYGSLPVEEIRKLRACVDEAIRAVEELTREFINQNTAE